MNHLRCVQSERKQNVPKQSRIVCSCDVVNARQEQCHRARYLEDSNENGSQRLAQAVVKKISNDLANAVALRVLRQTAHSERQMHDSQIEAGETKRQLIQLGEGRWDTPIEADRVLPPWDARVTSASSMGAHSILVPRG